MLTFVLACTHACNAHTRYQSELLILIRPTTLTCPPSRAQTHATHTPRYPPKGWNDVYFRQELDTHPEVFPDCHELGESTSCSDIPIMCSVSTADVLTHTVLCQQLSCSTQTLGLCMPLPGSTVSLCADHLVLLNATSVCSGRACQPSVASAMSLISANTVD